MLTDINYLLVGNSRLHWAEYTQKQYKLFHTTIDYKVPNNFNFQKLIWASVGKEPDFLLKKENEIKTKDIKLSNLPNNFGVDSALACLAALTTIKNPLKKNLLIADFGTILSVTKLTSNGSIIGGQMCPGFKTQLQSVELNAKNLKAPQKIEIPVENFLINTDDAILKGVINALTGVINSSFNPLEDILILCGGDSNLITRILKTENNNIINAPNLVLEGMVIHHQSLKS